MSTMPPRWLNEPGRLHQARPLVPAGGELVHQALHVVAPAGAEVEHPPPELLRRGQHGQQGLDAGDDEVRRIAVCRSWRRSWRCARRRGLRGELDQRPHPPRHRLRHRRELLVGEGVEGGEVQHALRGVAPGQEVPVPLLGPGSVLGHEHDRSPGAPVQAGHQEGLRRLADGGGGGRGGQGVVRPQGRERGAAAPTAATSRRNSGRSSRRETSPDKRMSCPYPQESAPSPPGTRGRRWHRRNIVVRPR